MLRSGDHKYTSLWTDITNKWIIWQFIFHFMYLSLIISDPDHSSDDPQCSIQRHVYFIATCASGALRSRLLLWSVRYSSKERTMKLANIYSKPWIMEYVAIYYEREQKYWLDNFKCKLNLLNMKTIIIKNINLLNLSNIKTIIKNNLILLCFNI